MEPWLIFLIGFGASFFGSLTSGVTSMLSMTGLLAAGLPMHTMLGVHRFGLFGFDVGGLPEFAKHKKVDWEITPGLIIAGSLAAFLGARLVLAIDEQLLERLLGVVILLIIPLMLFKPKLGIESTQATPAKKRMGYVAYFFTTLWGSTLNIGVGFFIMLTHFTFFGHSILQAKGTGKIPGMLRNVIILITFYFAGILNIKLGLVYLCGMFIGSTLAARFMIKIGDKWLKAILFTTVGLLALTFVIQ